MYFLYVLTDISKMLFILCLKCHKNNRNFNSYRHLDTPTIWKLFVAKLSFLTRIRVNTIFHYFTKLYIEKNVKKNMLIRNMSAI